MNRLPVTVLSGFLRRLDTALRRINPGARIERTTNGRLPPHCVVDTGLFSMDRARRMSGWAMGLRGEKLPETLEYFITSFVFRARRPFHPVRLFERLSKDWPGVLRVNGFLWLANRTSDVCFWQQAGRMCHTGKTGLWWAAVPARTLANKRPPSGADRRGNRCRHSGAGQPAQGRCHSPLLLYNLI